MRRISVICLVALALAAGACTSSAAPKAIVTAAPKPPTWVCSVTAALPQHFVETLFFTRRDLETANRHFDALFHILSDPGGYTHGLSNRHFTVECSTLRP